jgi:hypothetical protein
VRTRMNSAISAFVLRTAVFALLAGACLSPSRAFAQVSVTISPTAINLPPGATQQFASVVTGTSNSAVTWTVQEANGGTVDASGLYTAPDIVGAYHVVATSQADGTKSATAAVVLPGFVTWGFNTPRRFGSSATATVLGNGKILIAGNCSSNSAEIYDPAIDRSTNTTGILVARCGHTATLLPNGKVLLAGGQTSGGDTATAELYDPAAGTFTATGSMAAPRLQHTATLLSNGKVLMAGGVTCTPACVATASAELYDPGSGTFAATGSMSFPRNLPTATLLSDETVLVAGGIGVCTQTTPTTCPEELVAEIYDPNAGTFSQTGTMVGEPSEDASVLLSNGQVLFVGGINSTTAAVTAVAEIYDPLSKNFTQTGSLNIPRALASASLMSNGNVLIAGGSSTTVFPTQAEIYNPSTGKFTLTGSMHESRFDLAAIPLPSGEVLIAGGVAGAATTSTEFYDPATGLFSSHSVFMNFDRQNHTSTPLADGRILVAGGQSGLNNANVYASAEIYDPATNQFTLTGQMSAPREYHSATLLPSSGKVLVVGGFNTQTGNTIAATAELFDPASGTFSLTGSPSTPRAQHTATLLQNGKVLIAGGQSLSPNNPGLTSAEIYDPATGVFTPTGNMTVQRYGHTATLLNDGRVLIAGGIPTGFFSPPITGAPAEVYDPNTGTFTPLAPVSSPLSFPDGPFDSILLPSGKVLASLGFLFDPSTDTFTQLPQGGTNTGYRFTALPNGQILVLGLSPAELFDPTTNDFGANFPVPVIRTSPTANVLSTGQVLAAGGAAARQVDFYQPPLAIPAPTVTGISPNPVTGFSPVTITVQGANFAPGAVVMDFFQPLQTTFVSSAELTAVFPQSNLLLAGNHPIEVQNLQDPRVATFTLTVVNPQMQSSVTNGGSLSFGNASLGTNISQSVTFTNQGNATLTLNSFGISGANSADFTMSAGGTTCPLQGGTLAPLASCALNIQFAPSAVGLRGAELIASYETPTSPLSIPLSGTGVGVPVAVVTPPALTFGNQGLGTSSSSQSVTIQNSGTAALTITNIAATSGYQQTNNCPARLAINASCSIFVTFSPTLAGTNAGTLSITASDSANPHTVQLTGTGTGASSSAIAPPSLTFGSQAAGTSSTAQQVTVASVGTANLLITSIALTDTADFTETNNCPSSLAPNSNCSIAVTFVPASGGNITGSLVITASDGSPHTISLSGTGENFSISPTTGSSSSATVPAGQPAMYQMSLSPQVFSGTVNLICTEVTAIPGAACLISPSQVSLTGSAAVPVTVTVTTTARSLVVLPIRVPRFPHFAIGEMRTLQWLLALLLLLAFLCASRLSRRRTPLAISAFVLLTLMALGCGSGNYSGGGTGGNVGSTGTPAGTYQLLVSATSAGVSKTSTLKLTVK